MELNEVLTSARQLLKERTDSLQNDVKRCLAEDKDAQAAPFPALLYCFSIIDLLGALYGGNAGGDTTRQARNYMSAIMRCPEDRVFLLQEIFRHKIVHLAQPKPVTRVDHRLIARKLSKNKNLIKVGLYRWGIEHNKREVHLEIKPAEKQGEWRFWVSIQSLVEDIVDSVFKPNGYLHKLENEDDLQDKFQKAYDQIFEK